MKWSLLQRILVALLAVALAFTAMSSIQALPAGAQETDSSEAPEETESAPELQVERIERDQSTGVVEVEVIAPTELAGDRVPEEAISVQVNNTFIPFEYSVVSADRLEVALVLDISGSMRGDALVAAKAAAVSFVDRLPPSVSVGVVAFDSVPQVVAPMGTPVNAIFESIEALEVGSDTALYDAIIEANGLFEGTQESSRRVIVALTDGADSASTATPADVSSAMNGGVELFGIGLQTGETDTEQLQILSEDTGGTFSTSSTTALLPLYQDLAAKLSSRFTVRFEPPSLTEGRALIILSHNGTLASTDASFDEANIATEDESFVERSNAGGSLGAYTAPVPYRLDTGGFFSTTTARNVGIGLLGGMLLLIGLLAAFPSQQMTTLAQSGRDRASNVAVGDLTNRLEGVADRRLSIERRQRMSKALERAGMDLRASEFIVMVLAIAIAVAMMVFLFQGVLLALLAFIGTIVVARWRVRRKGRKRSEAFVDQLPATLQLIAGALRAGYALPQAAETVAAETISPTSDEFHRLVTEHRLGRDFSDALAAMDQRLQVEDFSWVVQALEIHRQVGGDLAEVLENVTRTMRDRSFIRRQFAALSAEGRYSAYLIVSLPFVVVGAMAVLNPEYIGKLFEGPRGFFVVLLALTLMGIGSLWMKALMKVKF